MDSSQRQKLANDWLQIFLISLGAFIAVLLILYSLPFLTHSSASEIIISVPQWEQTRDTSIAFALGSGATALLITIGIWFYYDEKLIAQEKRDRIRQIIQEELAKVKNV